MERNDLSFDVNHIDKLGETALTRAVCAERVDVVRQLIAAGAGVNTPNTLCITPICFAVWANNVQLVHILLAAGANPCPDDGPVTPLNEAIHQRSTAIVELLLEHGADVNRCCSRSGFPPLYYAVNSWNFDMDVIEALLRHGADPNKLCVINMNSVNRVYETVFDFAVKTVDLSLAKLLLQFGAHPNVWSHTLCSAFRSDLTLYFNEERQSHVIAIIKLLIPLAKNFNIEVYDDNANAWVNESCLRQSLRLELERHPRDLHLTRFLLQHGVTARFDVLFDVMLRVSPTQLAESECFRDEFLQLLRCAGVDFSGVLSLPSSRIRRHAAQRSYLAMVKKRLAMPLSLEDITRQRIRRLVGVPQLWKAIDALPLPTRLKCSLRLLTSRDAHDAMCISH